MIMGVLIKTPKFIQRTGKIMLNSYNPYSNNQTFIKGRLVSNVSEVQAMAIDMSGETFYFPCYSENCIYTKSIGLDGRAIINRFIYEEPPKPAPQKNGYDSIRDALSALEDKVKVLEGRLSNVQSTEQPTEQSTASNA